MPKDAAEALPLETFTVKLDEALCNPMHSVILYLHFPCLHGPTLSDLGFAFVRNSKGFKSKVLVLGVMRAALCPSDDLGS